jgi:hypothetical protein
MVGMGLALSTGSSSELSAQSQNPCAAKKPVAGKGSLQSLRCRCGSAVQSLRRRG